MILGIKGWKLDDGLYQQDLVQAVWPTGQYGDPNDPNNPQQKQAQMALQGQKPTDQPYDPNVNNTDTAITGQGNEPPYRDHNYLPAGTYPNKNPPNATKRGVTAGRGFGSSPGGESEYSALKKAFLKKAGIMGSVKSGT